MVKSKTHEQTKQNNSSFILFCFTEILLEPETQFTVVMVEEDKDHPNVTRAVLEVKKKPPILGDTIKKFRETFDPEEESQLRMMLEQKYSFTYGAAHFSLHKSSYEVLRLGKPVARPGTKSGDTINSNNEYGAAADGPEESISEEEGGEPEKKVIGIE